MGKIAPSILSANFGILEEEIRAVEKAGADLIHIDVMDGRFVPNLTFGPPVIASIRHVTRLPFDVHLMIEHPERVIGDYAAAGSDYITIHVEAERHLHRAVQRIKEKGIKAGISLNPATPLALAEEILPAIDLLLIMTVNPGFGGQDFIPGSLEKIRRARSLIDTRAPGVLLEVDGGVKVDNIGAIRDAGCDVFVAGSAIFHSSNYAVTIGAMKGILGRKDR